MTKAEFVELVQEKGGYSTKVAAEKAIKAFTDAVSAALVKKEEVSLVGFGAFSVAKVAEKSGTVPGTDKKYTKAAHNAPKFKAGKTLKEAVAK